MQPIEQILTNTSTLTVGDINGKTRTANIFADNKTLRVILSQKATLTTPWQVSSFDGTSDRCSLDLIVTEENLLGEFVDKVDEQILAFVKQNISRYSKQSVDDLVRSFRPLRRQASKEGYSDTLRCKLTLSDNKCSAKAWDGNKTPLSPAELKELDWPGCKLAVVVTISGVYFQAGSWGGILNTHMIQCLANASPSRACPFSADGEQLESSWV